MAGLDARVLPQSVLEEEVGRLDARVLPQNVLEEEMAGVDARILPQSVLTVLNQLDNFTLSLENVTASPGTKVQ